MLSKTKIKERITRKTSSSLVETLNLARKVNEELASALAVPTKKQSKINVGILSEGKAEVLIVPGKVLSNGEIKRKFKVYALGFSQVAKEKLDKAGCEFDTILNFLKNGKNLKGEIIK